MEEEAKRGLESLKLSSEKEEEIFIRCYRMVEHLNDIAGEILMDLLHNSTCPVSRQLLKNSPETVVIKTFEEAINRLKPKIREKNLHN
jgi:hypothetical protein